MAAVTGIDHRHVGGDMLGDEVRSAAVGMANNKHVGVHRLQGHQRVLQGFPFLGGRSVDVQVQHVGGQTLGGQFKGGQGAGAVFEKQVGNGFAPQQRDLLHLLLAHVDEGVDRKSTRLNSSHVRISYAVFCLKKKKKKKR